MKRVVIMNAEKYIKALYHDIWQGHDVEKIGDYYAKDAQATISVSKNAQDPEDITLDFDGIHQQALWQKSHYKNLKFDFKEIVLSQDEKVISALFWSQSTCVKTGETRNFRVMGMWMLNDEKKINKVCAVMTPYYPFEH